LFEIKVERGPGPTKFMVSWDLGPNRSFIRVCIYRFRIYSGNRLVVYGIMVTILTYNQYNAVIRIIICMKFDLSILINLVYYKQLNNII